MTKQEVIKKFDRKEALNELKREVSIRGNLSPFAKKMFEYLEEDLKEYYKLKDKPTEQEVIKKFEDMGYRYKPIIIENEVCWAVFFNYETDAVIQIHKKELIFEKYDDSNLLHIYFTIQEHQLINELFKCWGKI